MSDVTFSKTPAQLLRAIRTVALVNNSACACAWNFVSFNISSYVKTKNSKQNLRKWRESFWVILCHFLSLPKKLKQKLSRANLSPDWLDFLFHLFVLKFFCHIINWHQNMWFVMACFFESCLQFPMEVQRGCQPKISVLTCRKGYFKLMFNIIQVNKMEEMQTVSASRLSTSSQ